MTLLKHSIRQLILRPALSVTVIAMLALGVGAATAIFSLFHEVLVRPLPVPEPERLVNIARAGSEPLSRREALSYPLFRDLEAGQSGFTGIAAHTPFTANLMLDEGAIRVPATFISGSYFDVLGLQPAIGRLIGRQDEPRIGESPVVVLSHDIWQNRFGGDPGIVGRSLSINGRPLTVIGVAPEGFSGTRLAVRTQVFVPITMRWQLIPVFGPDTPDTPENRRFDWMLLFARLAGNVTVEEASAGINALYARILSEIEAPLQSSDDERRELLAQRLELVPGARGQGSIAGGAQSLSLLLGVTVLVLLIVCVNVANLLLVRGASRAGEMAIRESMGASRGRLVAELFAESAGPALIGGALALPVASVTLAAVTPILPASLADGLAMELDSNAVLFAALATIGAAILFGLFPALRSARTDPVLAMKGQAAHALGGHGAPRVRAVLVTAQIAFSLVLLVLAGLFARSLLNIARIDLGIDVDSLATFSVSPQVNGYDADETMALYDRIEEALAAQPGVAAVASASLPVIDGGAYVLTFPLERVDGTAEPVTSSFNVVSDSFFRTLGIPLLAGRGFTPNDMSSGANVAIVNERFARQYRLGDDAVGMPIMLLDERMEIIGIVADAAYSEIKGDVPPQLFVPRGSISDETPFSGLTSATFYVHTTLDPDALLPTIRQVVAGIDPRLPVEDLTTMRRHANERIFVDRLVTILSAAFAVLATLLAAIGLYGVLAYSVAARTRELGLRLALGADPVDLRAMVMRQVARMAAIGIVVGLAAAVGSGRLIEALLFGLSSRDPVVLVAAAVVLIAVVLAASYVPGRRASRIVPMEALRHE